MLELHKKKNSRPPSAEREKIELEIAVTDEKIDEMVYGLYGITEEERMVIEGKQADWCYNKICLPISRFNRNLEN